MAPLRPVSVPSLPSIHCFYFLGVSRRSAPKNDNAYSGVNLLSLPQHRKKIEEGKSDHPKQPMVQNEPTGPGRFFVTDPKRLKPANEKAVSQKRMQCLLGVEHENHGSVRARQGA